MTIHILIRFPARQVKGLSGESDLCQRESCGIRYPLMESEMVRKGKEIMRQKTGLLFSVFIFLMVFFAACGQKEDEGYYEIMTRTEQMTNDATVVDSGGEEYVYLGSQFYQGERVQIWGESKTEGEAFISTERMAAGNC